MLCRNPFVQGDTAFPCGQCMPCRLNRRRVWTHRLMLEQLQHSDSSFVTLTYDDDHLPVTNSLDPKHLQDWLKRFRKAIAPLKIRYYAVGEYGDVSQRPHYHIALFGYPSCRFGVSRYSRTRSECCSSCELVRTSWSFGHVLLGTLGEHSCQYVAGYVTKKMTAKDDARLNGRHPEFGRMSLRPGLGYDALHELASVLLSHDIVDVNSDVPAALRHGSRLMPLGRYLRRQLRMMTGIDGVSYLNAEMQALYESASLATRDLKVSGARSTLFKNLLIDASEGKVASLEARQRVYKKRSSL